MNEIKEIMNGNIKIFNMRIEGETIGFDTPYNSNWNFMARDFEQIIDTLQQENALLKDKIEKVIDYANSDEFEQLFESCANFNEANCNINHFLKEN